MYWISKRMRGEGEKGSKKSEAYVRSKKWEERVSKN